MKFYALLLVGVVLILLVLDPVDSKKKKKKDKKKKKKSKGPEAKSASGPRCTLFTMLPDLKVHELASKVGVIEAKNLNKAKIECEKDKTCMSMSCSRTAANPKYFTCSVYSLAHDELAALNYKVPDEESTVIECIPDYVCSCCIVGDPIVEMSDGTWKKFTTNGVFQFALAQNTWYNTCHLDATVTTAVTNPLQPNHSRVTVLRVQVGSRVFELDSTALLDEFPILKVDNVIVPAPYSKFSDPEVFISESGGVITVRVTQCDVKITFTDFKYSKACLSVPFKPYKKDWNESAGWKLCGKCQKNPTKAHPKNAEFDPEDALIG